jgi:hypothetical protein
MRIDDYSKLPEGIQWIPGMDLLSLRDYYVKVTEDENEFDKFCKVWVRRYNRENRPIPPLDDKSCPRSLLKETILKQIELIDTAIVSQRRVKR